MLEYIFDRMNVLTLEISEELFGCIDPSRPQKRPFVIVGTRDDGDVDVIPGRKQFASVSRNNVAVEYRAPSRSIRGVDRGVDHLKGRVAQTAEDVGCVGAVREVHNALILAVEVLRGVLRVGLDGVTGLHDRTSEELVVSPVVRHEMKPSGHGPGTLAYSCKVSTRDRDAVSQGLTPDSDLSRIAYS